jgi:Family of unknown function (DUF5989)
MAFVREFAVFLRHRKKYWLAPILLLTLIAGALLALAQSSAIGAFLYTLF